MTCKNKDGLALYWISGSPPAWRVMLALLLKNAPYQSRRLDHANGENKAPAYLALNPKGQVPTLVHNDVVVRESIAIIAYIDQACTGLPLFGNSLAETADVWQCVMDFESNLRPHVTTIAQALLRGNKASQHESLPEARERLIDHLGQLNNRLAVAPWICGQQPSAADCWLYPSIAWVERAANVSASDASEAFKTPLQDFKNLKNWRARVEVLDGFEETIPPHWK